MKIRAERKPLADALTWVASAVGRRPVVAALAGMRLSARDGVLVARAFDYDVAHEATVDVEVAGEGECLVPAAFVAQLLGSLKTAAVELVLDDDKLTITSGRSTYTTQVLRLEDYPTLPEFPSPVGHVDAGALTHIVGAVKSLVDDESIYEQVQGLRVEGSAEEVTVVGANRNAIAVAWWPWLSRETFGATVPVRSMLAAVKGLSGEVEIGHLDSMLGLRDEHRAVTMRCFAADYVAWPKLVRPDAEDAFAVEVGADELRESIKRAATLAEDEMATIGLQLRADELEVAALGATANGSEVIEVACPQEVSIGLNSRYVVDALAAMSGGDVRIGIIGARKPLVLRPVNNPRMTFVIQPKNLPGGTS